LGHAHIEWIPKGIYPFAFIKNIVRLQA